jgi:hypothetical protein
LVSRTLDRRHPGQDNVSVVSITLDSESLGVFAPEPPPSIFEAPDETPAAPKSASASGKLWLLAALFLLLLAAAFAGLWYFSAR